MLKDHSFISKMHKRGVPIVERALDLLRISILAAKMGKPMVPRLAFSKKRTRKLKLIKHYNYGFVKEYEFSPCSTPLFQRYKSPFKKRSPREIYSMLCLCRSLRVEGGDPFEEEENYGFEAAMVEYGGGTNELADDEVNSVQESALDDSYSVDQRAEQFIQRFYEDMRNQRS